MNVLNIYSIVSFSLFFVNHLSYGKPENDESMVPEDIEDGSILDENEPPAQGGAKLSPSAIEEYMKEHPEVKQIPTSGANGVSGKMKRVYNKFGDVVSIPDTSVDKTKVDTKKSQQNGQMLQQIAPNPYPMNPYLNPYSMNPYLNNQFGGLQQGFPQIPPQQPPQPGSPVSPQELAKYQLKPRTEADDQTKSESEVNEKMYQMMQNQQIPRQMPPMGSNGTVNGLFAPFPPLMMQQMMPQMMQPFPPPFPPFQPLYNPNQYQIDNKNIKIMPMSFPNDAGMDPNLLKKLQSGSAQLDMANARVIPMDTGPTTEEPLPPTESDSLDDRPELPEVVLPKPKPTSKSTPKRRPKGKRRHSKHRPKHAARKPHYLMRARLNELPKKGQKGGDEWWTKPVPDYCNEAIIEITNCKDKHLEKRWSFNKEDEKCYLYEDLCFNVKKNTFKSLKDCMTACWRPK